MSVVMAGRRERRRRWLVVVALAMVAMGVGVGVGVGAANRDTGDAMGGSLAQAEGRAGSEAVAARFASEARDPAFAGPREAFVRGPLEAAVRDGLPEVTLIDAACRATMCRLAYQTSDEFSAMALAHAPWPGLRAASISYGAGPHRVEIVAQGMPAEDPGIATWFHGVTAGRELRIELARGRLDPHVVDLAVAWQRAHARQGR